MKKKDRENKCDPEKTLTGLIIKSTTSGAVYLWNREKKTTVCIGGNLKDDRPIGLTVGLFPHDHCFGVKEGKIIVMDNQPTPIHVVLHEIHDVKL